MGILDSDIGYQIGLLAGGLWAERYRQRGEEKESQAQPYFNKNLFNQTAHEHLMNIPPALKSFNSNTYPYNTNQTSAIKPYQNLYFNRR